MRDDSERLPERLDSAAQSPRLRAFARDAVAPTALSKRQAPQRGATPASGRPSVGSPPSGGHSGAAVSELEGFQPLDLQRHPLPFDPRRVPSYRFDVVVVGSGVAGAAAALAAAERGLSVAVLSKTELSETNTRYAQGGLAVVFATEDSFESHVNDTLHAGMGISEREVVETVVRGGPGAVERLLLAGTRFDRDARGAIELSREGGHTHPRVAHANGDATGLEIQRCLTAALGGHERIVLFPYTFAVDLLCDDGGEVFGVLAQTARGDLVAFEARDVVLATGGSGHVYRETTNPVIATGDGVALGFRAGARVRDMEFFQFHPTCLYIAGAARVLISEIVRGAGGVLRDRYGERFMVGRHPAAELAPRDVVSRGVSQRMLETNDTNVYLDLTGITNDPHALFPGISRICRAFGIDIARDPIPVRPGAHYQIGGIEVDASGRSSLAGLWAVGECSNSGLHGANRLGSNSLLEGLVLGERVGEALAAGGSRRAGGTQRLLEVHGHRRAALETDASLNLEDLTYSLKSMMWRRMGVLRDAEGLEEIHGKLAFWTRVVQDLAPREPNALELIDMLTVARLATVCARARQESRGVHARTDHPEPVAEWRAHTVLEPVLEHGRVAGAVLTRVAMHDPVESSR